MKNGRYQCKIYHAGRFHNINVDDYFPVSTYMVPVKQNGEKNNDENNNNMLNMYQISTQNTRERIDLLIKKLSFQEDKIIHDIF